MNTLFTDHIQDVINAAHYRPAISVILPLDIKINVRKEITKTLKTAANKVMAELNEKYPGDITALMMKKLDTIFKHVDFDSGKKSVVVYLSPIFEKVFYLDIPVEEKIIIDESFEIRDLVYSKKEVHKFLVLCMTGKDSRIFMYDSKNFIRILETIPGSVYAYTNEVPERVANFSDVSKRKEVAMEKYLHHIDASLDEILKRYHLPVFVLGAKRMLGHYKKDTRHADSIAGYIHGNYADASLEELKNVLDPYIENWKKTEQKKLLDQLEAAANKKKLVAGIRDVWHEAINKQGKLLVVEKNYMYAARHGSKPDILYEPFETNNTFSVIKDAVDDLIEKTLQDGGDVEFVDAGVLKDYDHIALVKYF